MQLSKKFTSRKGLYGMMHHAYTVLSGDHNLKTSLRHDTPHLRRSGVTTGRQHHAHTTLSCVHHLKLSPHHMIHLNTPSLYNSLLCATRKHLSNMMHHAYTSHSQVFQVTRSWIQVPGSRIISMLVSRGVNGARL